MSVAAPRGVALQGGVEAALQRRQRASHPRLDGAERLAHLGRRPRRGSGPGRTRARRSAAALADSLSMQAASERASAARLSRSSGPGDSSATVSYTSSSSLSRPSLEASAGAHLGLGLQAAQAVDGAVARDAREPREGLALRRVEAARRPPDVDVHLLQDVFGLGPVAVDTQHDGEQMRARPLVERGKSRTIAESGAGQQARQIVAALGPVGGRSEHGCGLQAGRSAPCVPSYNSSARKVNRRDSWPVPSRPHRPSSPPTTSSSSSTRRCDAATSSA